jgi:hypothetical protein
VAANGHAESKAFNREPAEHEGRARRRCGEQNQRSDGEEKSCRH